MNAQIFLCQMSLVTFSQVISLKPSLADKNCYQFKLLYGLFVVAIVTGFFSVLGLFLHLQTFITSTFDIRNGDREVSSFCRVQKPPAYHQVIKQYNAPQMCDIRLYELQKVLYRLVSLFLDYGDTFCHDSSHAGLSLFYNINF